MAFGQSGIWVKGSDTVRRSRRREDAVRSAIPTGFNFLDDIKFGSSGELKSGKEECFIFAVKSRAFCYNEKNQRAPDHRRNRLVIVGSHMGIGYAARRFRELYPNFILTKKQRQFNLVISCFIKVEVFGLVTEKDLENNRIVWFDI